MRLLRRDPERVAVDRAVLFPRQMFRRFGGETIECGNESERRGRTRDPVSLHQIFGQEQISDRRQNRHEQDADCVFALIEQALHESERAFEVASRQRVPQFENHSGAREWHQLTHLIDLDAPLDAENDSLGVYAWSAGSPGN